MTAQDIVAEVVGQLCWRAERGHGSFLTFEFSERVASPPRDHGQWHLWVYFGEWTLSGPEGVLATSDDDEEVMDSAVGAFSGNRLTSADIDPLTLDASFDFESGLRLEVGHNSNDDEPDAESWLLFTPEERVLAVGPGPSWNYRSSHEP